MADVTLKPCPFCGSPGELEHGNDHHGNWFNLGCSDHWGKRTDGLGCKAGRLWYTETDTPEADAIAAWNTRPASPSDGEAVALLDELLHSNRLLWNHTGDGCERRSLENEVDATYAAVLARMRGAAVPEGWQLVPKEPTPEMVEAYGDAQWPGDERLYADEHESDEAGHRAGYAAMLAKTPSPEVKK